jgi:hypothetical protein
MEMKKEGEKGKEAADLGIERGNTGFTQLNSPRYYPGLFRLGG